MILTHFEPRQEEGNTLNPGSKPANYQPTGKISRFYMDIYIITLHKNKKKINSTWENPKEKELKWSGKDDEPLLSSINLKILKHRLRTRRSKGKLIFLLDEGLRLLWWRKQKANQGKYIYEEKRQRNTIQKKKERKKVTMKKCSTCRKDFDQK